jgi:Uma2 family endonuclease
MAFDRVTLTYEDYLAMPDDGRRYEILDGEVAVSAAPGTLHQIVLANLNDVVRSHVRAHGLGRVFFAPLAVILADTTVVEPDLVFVESGRMGIVTDRGLEGTPTLLVEVLSPGTTSIDREPKFRLYARHGVPYYWIVDVEGRAIEGYEAVAGAYRLVVRGAGSTPVALPPLVDLEIVPDSLRQP